MAPPHPNKKKPRASSDWLGALGIIPGGDLLSHRVSPAVPSALEVLTSEFEMGSGVAPPVRPPESFAVRRVDGEPLLRTLLTFGVLSCNQALDLINGASNKESNGDQAARPISTG